MQQQVHFRDGHGKHIATVPRIPNTVGSLFAMLYNSNVSFDEIPGTIDGNRATRRNVARALYRKVSRAGRGVANFKPVPYVSMTRDAIKARRLAYLANPREVHTGEMESATLIDDTNFIREFTGELVGLHDPVDQTEIRKEVSADDEAEAKRKHKNELARKRRAEAKKS